MNNYEFAGAAIEKVVSVMEKQNKQNRKEPSALKFAIHLSYEKLNRKKTEMKESQRHNNETLAEHLAIEQNKALQMGYNEDVIKEKKVLNSMIDYVQERISNAIDRQFLIPPTDYMLRLYKCAEIKAPKMSDAEWILYAGAFAKNYQMLSCFKTLGDKYDKNIILPYTYDTVKEDSQQLVNYAREAVSFIDAPENATNRYSCLEFYKDFEGGEIDGLIEEINACLLEYVSDKYFSLREELEKAKQKAFDKDDIKLSAQINLFLERNREVFDEPGRITEDIYKHGEELIAKANTVRN